MTGAEIRRCANSRRRIFVKNTLTSPVPPSGTQGGNGSENTKVRKIYSFLKNFCRLLLKCKFCGLWLFAFGGLSELWVGIRETDFCPAPQAGRGN